MKSYRHF